MAREKLSDKVARLEKELELATDVIKSQADKLSSKSFYQPFVWGMSAGLLLAFLIRTIL